MIAMNETLLTGKMKVSLPAYVSWNKHRKDKGGGGVATAVSNEYSEYTVGAGEGCDDDEYLITRVESFKPALSVINCYGEQRKTNKEVVEEKWKRLKKDMEDIRARGEFCCLTGDLNKLVGTGQLGIPGNHPEVSLGGRLLRDLLATRNWYLVNGLGQEVVTGGPYTRKDLATGVMSCLDMFVVSRELLPYVQKLNIDSQREMAVGRSVKMGSKYQMVYSDHFTCVMTLSDLPRVKEAMQQKQTVWNLSKQGGWDMYKDMTNKYSQALEEMLQKEDTINNKMKAFDKIQEKIKYKAFGKVTIGSKVGERKQSDDADRNVDAKELFEEESKRVEEEIEEIKNMKKAKVGKIWEIRKRVIGGMKKKNEQTAIVDPGTGKVVGSRMKIKEVTLKYCKDTLKNNTTPEGYEKAFTAKKRDVENKLLECDGTFKPSKEAFEDLIMKFKKSKKRNYDFLVKSSKSFQDVVFKFSSEMFEKEQFPDSFRETTLHMIFKGGQGRRHILSDNRFIHSKFWFPRAAEGLVVVEGLKAPLIEGSSRYQVGLQPGHRAEELIFVLKSVISRYRKEGKLVIVQTSDISKFFDKET